MFVKVFILIFVLFSSLNSDGLTNHRIVKLEESLKIISNDNDSLKIDNKELKTKIENLNKQNSDQFSFYKETLTNNQNSNSNTLDFLFKVITALYLLTLSIFGLVGWGLKSSLTKWLSDQIKHGIQEKVSEDSINQILKNVKDSVVNEGRAEMMGIMNTLQQTLQSHENLLNKHSSFIEQFSDVDPLNISKSQQILVTQEANQAEHKAHKDEEDWFAIALKAHNTNEYTKAIYAYNKSLQINPKNATAILNLGLVYTKQGLFDLAEKYFQDALNINPNNARGYYLLAEMYKDDLHNNEQAEHYYKIAIQTDPNYTLAFTSYAEFLEEEGNTELANHYFLEGLHNNPDDSYTHNRYGSFLLRQNHDLEKVKAHFLKAISLNPNYIFALLNYATLCWKTLGNLEEAKKYLLKALESEPKNIYVLLDYADYLFETGNLDKAKIYYEQAMNIDPTKVTYRTGYKEIFENA